LATVTKPDREQLDAERARRALKLTRAAKAKAAKIAIDKEKNLSTRRHQALKVRSDAIDQIEAALTGKDAAKS
jgi:hypothetical protein